MRRVPAPLRPLATLRTLALASLTGAAACSTPDAGPDATPADVTVFEGARIIVGDDSEPIENGAFVVADGRFTQVGAAGALDVPVGATRVDLSGRTVMPAIINAHMHLATTREARTEELRHNAYYGAAAVVSLGHDPGELAFAMRDEVIPGAARSLTAGRGITRPEPGRTDVPYWVDTVEEARQAVRELAAREVDIVKIWVDDRSGRYEKLTSELYGAIIDEAHANDLRVTAHIFTLEDAKGLLRADIDAFAHSVRDRDVDDEFMALIAERANTFYVPNLPNAGTARDLSWLAGTIPAGELAATQDEARDAPGPSESFSIQARNLERLSEAGVRIAFGTDGGSPWAAHLEMEDMVAAGMSPAEVIVAATSTSAELMRLDDLGTIAPGKSAAFVVLAANPLEDITNTRRIEAVYLRGEPVDRDTFSQSALAPAADDGS